ncbi:MAG: hypothetical protein ACFFCZ_00715 [Promethearchaeota archaeon]
MAVVQPRVQDGNAAIVIAVIALSPHIISDPAQKERRVRSLFHLE